MHPMFRFSFWAATAALFGASLAGQTLQVSPASLTFIQQGSSPPLPQSIRVTMSNAANVAFSATASITSGTSGWFTVSVSGPNTPADVSVFITPGLAPGTYTGNVVITAAGQTQNVPVTLTVNANTQLTATQNALTFNAQVNSAIPPVQNLQISTISGSPIMFSTAASTTSGVQWLTVSPGSATTPAPITVGINRTDLAIGRHDGTITLTPATGGGGPLQIPVTLNIMAAPELRVSSNTLTFNHQINAANPPDQTLSVTSTGNQLPFSITVTTASGAGWLVVNPVNGGTTASITVGVNPSGLTPGQYTGNLAIIATGASNSPQNVSVVLNVSTNAFVNASPAAVAFNVQTGAALPTGQTVNLTGSGGATINVTASATTTTGGAWLSVTPTNATTPTAITIGLTQVAQNLLPGTYAGQISINAPSAGNPQQNIPVTLTVTNNPVLLVTPPVNPGLTYVFQTGRSNPAPQTIQVASSGTPIAFTVAAAVSTPAGGTWLSVNQPSGLTPSTLIVTVNPAGLPAGTYSGSIAITPTGEGVAPVTLPVTLIVSPNPLMVVSPSSLEFRFASGDTTQRNQTISLTSTGDPLNFTVTAATTSGGPGWLLVGPLNETTPELLNVTVTPLGLTPGTYNGTVTVAATNANTQVIPVTVTIASAATITVTPTALSFTQAAGGPAPASQNLSVTSAGGSVQFTAAPFTNIGGNWLDVQPRGGTTPGTLAVLVNGSGLAQGVYTGSITVAGSGAGPQTVQVTLTIGPAQTIGLAQSSLMFNFQVGGTTPAAQTVAVTSTGGPLSFTATVPSTCPWLRVTPATGTSPGTLNISVDPANVAPGTLNCAVPVASPAASNSPQTLNITLTVTPRAAGNVIAVQNGASFVPTAVSPGQIITLRGNGIGPATGVEFRLTSAGTVPTTVGDTRVLFDGIPAAVLYASATQVNAIVPYEITGRFSTRLQVEFLGTVSNTVDLLVVDTAPGIFTAGSQGSGQSAALNQDGTVNSATNPATKGSVIVLFATGEGQTNPAGVTASVSSASNLKRPLQNVTVTIGGRQAQVQYAGSAPGLVAGAVQVNAVIPEDTPSGPAAVVLTIGNSSSQPGVTIAVR